MFKKLLLSLSLLLALLVPLSVDADENANISTDTIYTSILHFIEYDDYNYPTINISALSENTSDINIVTIASMANKMLYQYKENQLYKEEIIVGVTKGYFPTYGNWCGDGKTMADRNGGAYDVLDWACKDHDLCYCDNGHFNAECDKQFIRKLKAIINHHPNLSVDGVFYARAADTFFSVLRNYGG